MNEVDKTLLAGVIAGVLVAPFVFLFFGVWGALFSPHLGVLIGFCKKVFFRDFVEVKS